MFCFFILNYLFLSSLFTTNICLLYLTQTLPLQYWLFRCNIEIMFPDNIGDHTPKIGDGVITVTLILITRVQCMLSPNIFSNLETFLESTPTPLQSHRSDEAELKWKKRHCTCRIQEICISFYCGFTGFDLFCQDELRITLFKSNPKVQ